MAQGPVACLSGPVAHQNALVHEVKILKDHKNAWKSRNHQKEPDN